MNITAKSRYALKIMMDLADYEKTGHQRRQEISERHGIPVDFMDHILAKLRASHLIESIRGRSGGFKLNKNAESITLWDIFSSVEESIYSVRCMSEGESCVGTHACISHDAWTEVYGTIKTSLESKNLMQIVEDWRLKKAQYSPSELKPIAFECKGPLKKSASKEASLPVQ